jgi:pSer/pThr/pTyr-binding forkhead associated (FHA) protein
MALPDVSRFLAQGVTPFALSALKYGLFALLVLFLWRSMRWAVRGLSVEQAAPRAARGERRRGPESQTSPATPPGLSGVVIRSDGQKARSIRVESSSLVLGRAPECELPLEDTYVSQQHARIFAKDGAWYVEDLGSTNGTFVNDQRLSSPAMVQSGDRIRLGTTEVELRR